MIDELRQELVASPQLINRVGDKGVCTQVHCTWESATNFLQLLPEPAAQQGVVDQEQLGADPEQCLFFLPQAPRRH